MWDFKGCRVALYPLKLEETLEPKRTAIQNLDVWGLFITLHSQRGNAERSSQARLLRDGHCTGGT